MDENLNRQIKIYCPQHQSIFEVDEKPQIVCEIREHALSNDFPKSEFWEYCCDCQIFSLSQFGTGGKAKNACPHCERATVNRFLCDACKIIAYDSDEETKGKIFGISAKNGSEPNCAGCQKSFVGAEIYQHDCTDIEGALLTNRQNCPFCQKAILIQPKKVESLPTIEAAMKFDNPTASTQCSNCGHWGKAERAVCGNCGAQINSLGAGVAAGTAVPKTQLLGSICPNCGTGNDADSTFCVNCGQALKTVPQTETETVASPIFPPTMPPIPVNQTNTFSAEQPVVSGYPPKNSPADSKISLLIILVTVGLFIVVGLIALNSSKPTPTSNSSASYSNNGKTSNNSMRTNSSTMNTSNSSKMDNTKMSNTMSNSSSPLTGRTGRLTTNLNIRGSSGKYSEIWGTHYEGARVQILEVESFYADDGEYVTWYRVKVLENGYDRKTGMGNGNNWERNGSFGWMEAEMEGWMNSKYISLQ